LFEITKYNIWGLHSGAIS